MDNLARSLIEAESKSLADVVQPDSLASYVTPETWDQARALARELDDARENLKAVESKIREVDEAIWTKGSRRVADVNAMADAALRGETPSEAPVVKLEGLAALSGQALVDLKSGLQAREREVKGKIQWLTGRCRAATHDVLKCAAEQIATEYAQELERAARKHILLDAAQQILGRGVIPSGWRAEKFLAPEVGKMRRIPGDAYSGVSYLAQFERGAGVGAAAADWFVAAQTATGQDVK